jgi:hypothetical protein
LSEKGRLRVSENGVLRSILVPKRDELTEEFRRLHNKELYALYSSQNIIRFIKLNRLRWVRRVARMEVKRGSYRVLVGKPDGRRPFGRPRRRWDDNIKVVLREMGLEHEVAYTGSR